MIKSTTGCFLKRSHHGGRRTVTVAGGIVNVKIAGDALTRKCRPARHSGRRRHHRSEPTRRVDAAWFIVSSQLTEGVSIDEYSTFRTTRFAALTGGAGNGRSGRFRATGGRMDFATFSEGGVALFRLKVW